MSEWQDISTAPKDGTMVLLRFGDVDECIVAGWDESPTSYPWQTLDGLGYHHNAFSHWMELPPKPTPLGGK